MKIIVDTNVLMSGLLFRGPSSRIVAAWSEGRIKPVMSPEIIKEYRAVAVRLSRWLGRDDISSIIALVEANGIIITPKALDAPVCRDIHDDKFIACALTSGPKTIISDDKDLLVLSGKLGLEILKPRTFMERHLQSRHSSGV